MHSYTMAARSGSQLCYIIATSVKGRPAALSIPEQMELIGSRTQKQPCATKGKQFNYIAYLLIGDEEK